MSVNNYQNCAKITPDLGFFSLKELDQKLIKIWSAFQDFPLIVAYKRKIGYFSLILPKVSFMCCVRSKLL